MKGHFHGIWRCPYLCLFCAYILPKKDDSLPMTLGYESYIIDNVEKYNLINLKKRLYFENFSCVYIMKGQIEGLPADFFRMSKSQLDKLFERASDAFIARMYDIPQYQVEKRRDDFGIKQLG